MVTLISQFFPASLVITILAHAFGVECLGGVRTQSNMLLLFALVLLPLYASAFAPSGFLVCGF